MKKALQKFLCFFRRFVDDIDNLIEKSGERMRIAICDDESYELERMAALLVEYRKTLEGHLEDTLDFCLYANASDLLAGIRGGEYDALILDVVMPGFSGIQAAREMRTVDQNVRIIFLSSTPEFAVESYSVGAYQYLLKPASRKALFPLLDQIRAEKSTLSAGGLLLRGRDGVSVVSFTRMEYVEVMNKTVFFHLSDNSVRETAGALVDYEEALLSRAEFVKVHRSYLINLQHIQAVNNDGATTHTGHKVPISRALYAHVKDSYLHYLFLPEAKPSPPPPPPVVSTPPPAERVLDGVWRILLVDDDSRDLEHWAELLRKQGCLVWTACDGTQALGFTAIESFDCVVLDVLLQGENGFDLCQILRERTGAPVLFLSCLTDMADQIRGFSAGGVDYITKDTPAELFWTKVETRIRLSRMDCAQVRFGPLLLDLSHRRLLVNEQELVLTPLEFDLLWMLSGHAGEVHTPEILYRTIWGAQQWDGAQTVQVHMSRLRRKLEKAYPSHIFIETVWGQGYRFMPIEVVALASMQ